MAQPPAYTRQISLTDYQVLNPSTPLPGTSVDAEFNAVKTTLDATLRNIALLQRDDGKLRNATVTPESFSAAALVLVGANFLPRGDWVASGTLYTIGDMVSTGGATYVCLITHTSSTLFSTDLAASRWQRLVGLDDGSVTAAKLTDDSAALQAITDKLAGTVKAATLSGVSADLQAIMDKLAGTVKAASLSSTTSDLDAITAKLRHKSAGTGSVSRTVSGKLSEINSVTDYNVLATDGTTDARAAIALAIVGGDCLFTAGTYRIASNITLTGNLRFAKGAKLKPDIGVTVTISGWVEAGLYQIFDTSASGSFANVGGGSTATPITTVYPEWWGATGLAGNQSSYIQAAINFIQGTAGGTVKLGNWYDCRTTLTVTGRIRIEGRGPVWGANVSDIARSSVLDFSSAAAGVGAILAQDGTSYINGFQLVNVGIFRSPADTPASGSVGVSLVAPKHYTIQGCMIFGFNTALQLNDNSGADAEAHDGAVDNCVLSGGPQATLILGGLAGLTFRDCTIFTSEASASTVVAIGRGINGKAADTLAFVDCRILALNLVSLTSTLVSITDGMWLSFNRTDLEGSGDAGILVQRDATAGDHSLDLKTVDIANCWFNGCGRNVVFSGYKANGRITDCRMENNSGGTSLVAIEFTSAGKADISIRGNFMRNTGTVAAITAQNAKDLRISDNLIIGEGVGVGASGILLGATTEYCIVTGNRVRSNNVAPINNAGASNVVANNIETTV